MKIENKRPPARGPATNREYIASNREGQARGRERGDRAKNLLFPLPRLGKRWKTAPSLPMRRLTAQHGAEVTRIGTCIRQHLNTMECEILGNVSRQPEEIIV